VTADGRRRKDHETAQLVVVGRVARVLRRRKSAVLRPAQASRWYETRRDERVKAEKRPSSRVRQAALCG
jgi:hypothetical protein